METLKVVGIKTGPQKVKENIYISQGEWNEENQRKSTRILKGWGKVSGLVISGWVSGFVGGRVRSVLKLSQMSLIVTTFQQLALALLNICRGFRSESPAMSMVLVFILFLTPHSIPPLPCLFFSVVSICSFWSHTSTHCKQQPRSNFLPISPLRSGWLPRKLTICKTIMPVLSVTEGYQGPNAVMNLCVLSH